ncbi:MAG: acetyl-CoA carboxylase biotin carboxyl carrier protein [candidate division KSB1 bacterium]|jgi:acetyl-CoA carboxylase biotin carboxyl carrier protein|nr:acetyl-CoA carboxylase biotin carboxyl carrier protein [candidate division KSB1 bacterium]
MRSKEIKKLIDLVEQSNISELEVSRWGRKVRIFKYGSQRSMKNGQQDTIFVSPPSAQPETVASATPPDVSQPSSAKEDGNTFDICSPMVGTFYRSPAPDAEPYVEAGKNVSKGEVLCIIEAMKLMNEIEAEKSGKIVEVLVENGQPVEYDQVLFKMEKV